MKKIIVSSLALSLIASVYIIQNSQAVSAPKKKSPVISVTAIKTQIQKAKDTMDSLDNIFRLVAADYETRQEVEGNNYSASLMTGREQLPKAASALSRAKYREALDAVTTSLRGLAQARRALLDSSKWTATKDDRIAEWQRFIAEVELRIPEALKKSIFSDGNVNLSDDILLTCAAPNIVYPKRACQGKWDIRKNLADCPYLACVKGKKEVLRCADALSYVNRNPKKGPIDQKCCPGLSLTKTKNKEFMCQRTEKGVECLKDTDCPQPLCVETSAICMSGKCAMPTCMSMVMIGNPPRPSDDVSPPSGEPAAAPTSKPSALSAPAKVGTERTPSGKCKAGEKINYKCADGTLVKWCVCDDLGWDCPIYQYAERLCPATKEITLESGQQIPATCVAGEAVNTKCSDGRTFRACRCEDLGETGKKAWECGLEPICPQPGPPTINKPHLSGAVTSDLTVELQTTPFGTVRITWSTNEPATSLVEYGLTTAYGSTAGPNYFGSTYQGVELSNLQTNTVYHFRIRAKDKDIAPNSIVTEDYTFTIRRLPDLAIFPISVDHFKADTPNKIHVSIHNNGVATASKGFVIKVYVGFVEPVLLVEGTYDSDLAAGATGEKIFDYTFSGAKNYSEIKAVIDATNLVTELIENNNDFQYGMSIYPASGQ